MVVMLVLCLVAVDVCLFLYVIFVWFRFVVGVGCLAFELICAFWCSGVVWLVLVLVTSVGFAI